MFLSLPNAIEYGLLERTKIHISCDLKQVCDYVLQHIDEGFGYPLAFAIIVKRRGIPSENNNKCVPLQQFYETDIEYGYRKRNLSSYGIVGWR
jgi:hypothetical protein